MSYLVLARHRLSLARHYLLATSSRRPNPNLFSDSRGLLQSPRLRLSRRPVHDNPFSDSPGLLSSPRLRLSGRSVPTNSPSLWSLSRSSVPRRVPTGGGAGAGRREAHMTHAADRGDAKLEGGPRAPSVSQAATSS
jgi:hypothetical protein